MHTSEHTVEQHPAGKVAQPTSTRVARRRVLRSAMLSATAILTTTLTAGAVGVLWPLGRHAVLRISVPATRLPAVGGPPYRDESGAFYLIHTSDGYLTLSSLCTHAPDRCTVVWEQSRNHFQCPCCGGVFDAHGVRLAGPPPRPLDLVACARGADGAIVATPSVVTASDHYDPAQSLKIW
jgi:cytochrome b6-f complex iron-sulfur subunit